MLGLSPEEWERLKKLQLEYNRRCYEISQILHSQIQPQILHMDDVNISVLLGKTLTNINVTEDEIYFTCSNGEEYKMYHDQSCCESVTIEDICGEIEWLLNEPILRAEERSNSDGPPRTNDNYPEYSDDSYTWTFYELATIKGAVTIRWYGTSNGYYSESVDFVRLNDVEIVTEHF